MIAAAENVILAMTIYSAIRPVVESYQKKILAQREWVSDPATSGAVASQSKCDDFQIGATGFSEDVASSLAAVVDSEYSLLN